MKFRSFYKIFFYLRIMARLKPSISTFSALGLSFAATLAFIPSANAQAALVNIAQLRTQVAQFLTDEYTQAQAVKVDVQVAKLDNRLRLAQCSQELAMQLQDTAKNGGNVNVQVRCNGNSAWTILVPAQAKVYRYVAVAGRNLQRGDVVSAADVSRALKNTGDFKLGFALTADEIIGQEMKMAINKDDVFRKAALDSPLVIKRGDTVSMEALAGDISVRTSGTAVSDGRIGQQIRIKNNQSARIINARVIGAGKVHSIL